MSCKPKVLVPGEHKQHEATWRPQRTASMGGASGALELSSADGSRARCTQPATPRHISTSPPHLRHISPHLHISHLHLHLHLRPAAAAAATVHPRYSCGSALVRDTLETPAFTTQYSHSVRVASASPTRQRNAHTRTRASPRLSSLRAPSRLLRTRPPHLHPSVHLRTLRTSAPSAPPITSHLRTPPHLCTSAPLHPAYTLRASAPAPPPACSAAMTSPSQRA